MQISNHALALIKASERSHQSDESAQQMLQEKKEASRQFQNTQGLKAGSRMRAMVSPHAAHSKPSLSGPWVGVLKAREAAHIFSVSVKMFMIWFEAHPPDELI